MHLPRKSKLVRLIAERQQLASLVERIKSAWKSPLPVHSCEHLSEKTYQRMTRGGPL
jgi:hypothetical protein